MKNKSTDKRNMGLEYLRICSMLMIILLHAIDHSGLLKTIVLGSPLYYYEQFLYALVQVCVNCFVLISGYFLINSKFKPEKLVSLWIEVVFYSLIIKIIMMIFGEIPFSIFSLVSCFVPVLTGRYWFVTIYFGMYLLSPFINSAIKAMNQKQHGSLLILLFVLFSVMISIYPSFKGMNSGNGWGLTWFIVLYFIAAYIRRYHIPNGRWKKHLLVFFLCPVLMLIMLWFAQRLGINIFVVMVENFWRYDSFPVLIASMALFLAFLNRNNTFIKSERIQRLVIGLSKTTFGVYLIHAHANLCTEIMWQRIGMVTNLDAWWFPVYQIGVVLIIFILCAILDNVREKIFKVVKVEWLLVEIVNFTQNLLVRGNTDDCEYKD